MKIVMFMLFFVCNMFTVLIIRFAYESNYRYNNGMLIGVHIPGDHVNDDDVTRLMARFKKSMKYFQNINMDIEFREKLESELELLSAEASITGMDKEEFLKICENIYSKMNPCTM